MAITAFREGGLADDGGDAARKRRRLRIPLDCSTAEAARMLRLYFNWEVPSREASCGKGGAVCCTMPGRRPGCLTGHPGRCSGYTALSDIPRNRTAPLTGCGPRGERGLQLSRAQASVANIFIDRPTRPG